MSLGELIRSARERAGMSLQDLADATGASKGHLHGVEQGKTVDIGILLAARLSIALGLTITALASAAVGSAMIATGGDK